MLKLLNNEKLIVGYDLGDSYSQISYCIGSSEQVETLSMVAGAEDFNIPTVLCKREGVNQWFCGREALRYSSENGGILVESLLGLAAAGEPVQIEGNGIDPVSLLTLFLKRSLGMLFQVASIDRISALMITCGHLDQKLLPVLQQAVAGLRLRTDKIFFQSHTESFYNYMLYQPEDLWRARVLLMECRGECIRAFSMECNKHTSPTVVYIDELEYPFVTDLASPEQMDEDMLLLAQRVCEEKPVSGIYLIGEEFSGGWMRESLRYLCRGRRIFQGNNLYSKGACFGMKERLEPGSAGKAHVFLGNDKLKSNVGMKILRQGEKIYFAILDAGTNWFEAKNTFDFYMQGGSRVDLMITSLTGKGNKLAEITLEDMEEGLSRLRARIGLSDESHIVVEIEDLGLGVFRPASHHVWREEIEI